jgi:hypothetical protein
MKKIGLLLLLMTFVCGIAIASPRVKHHRAVVANPVDTTQAAVDSSDYSPTYVDSVDSASTNDDVTTADNGDNDVKDLSELDHVFGHYFPSVMVVTTICVICGCLLLGVIIFCVFYFTYKNRRERYRIVEKSIEKGQPLPTGFYSSQAAPRAAKQAPRVKANVNANTNGKPSAGNYDVYLRDKGLRNIFLGLGLFVFLWALINFAMGCIGLLVALYGASQYVTWYYHEKDMQHFSSLYDDEPATPESAIQEQQEEAPQADAPTDTPSDVPSDTPSATVENGEQQTNESDDTAK